MARYNPKIKVYTDGIVDFKKDCVDRNNGNLWSEGKTGRLSRTQIRVEDLPNWYIKTYRTGGMNDYVCIKGITNIVYNPDMSCVCNHLHKDETLYIAYDNKEWIIETKGNIIDSTYWEEHPLTRRIISNNVDSYIWGNDIYYALNKIIELNENPNIVDKAKQCLKEMKQKENWYMENRLQPWENNLKGYFYECTNNKIVEVKQNGI